MGSPRRPDRAAPAAESAEAEPPEVAARGLPREFVVRASSGPGVLTAGGHPSDGPCPEPEVTNEAAVIPEEATPEEDQEAADAERACHRGGTQEPLEPDGLIAPLLSAGEVVLAARRSAVLERRHPRSGGQPLRGALYITSRRLVHVGDHVVSHELERIREAIVAGGRLLILLNDGSSLEICVDRPRLLRVEMALSRAARRDCSTRSRPEWSPASRGPAVR